jgi:hypothetical protein
MQSRADRQRRPLHRLALGACVFVLGASAPAFGQLLEFKSSELRGRIDRPTSENVWILGDNNGNGTIDENESLGPRLAVDDVFLDNPGFTNIGPEPEPRSLSAHTGDGTAGFSLNSQFSNHGSATVDYPNLVQLPGPDQSLGVQSFARFGGAHLMQVLEFEGEPEFTISSTHETLEIGYGARFYSSLQNHRFPASGRTIGLITLETDVQSQALGPQVSLKWTIRHGPWQASAEAAAALTYLSIDGDQGGQTGEELIPGQFNRPAFMTSSRIDNHLNEWDLAPAFEAGVRGSYDLTPTTQCFIRGDAVQFGNVRDAEDAIVYSLPSMGLHDPGGYDVTVTAASIGIEVRR